MPSLLLWALHRTGYDRRGWALQCAIALPLFIAARFTAPAENINFAFSDPFVHRPWGPAPDSRADQLALYGVRGLFADASGAEENFPRASSARVVKR